jgi:hypothetical protein
LALRLLLLVLLLLMMVEHAANATHARVAE